MHKQYPSIHIQKLDAESCKDLAVLYHAVYGRKMDPAFFRKKYAGGTGGLAYPGYIAYDNVHSPLAFIGAVTCKLFYEGRSVSAAQLTDGMTHPAWRGKGLFVQLVEELTALCSQHGVQFLFGFPNQHSLPVFLNRLGWQVYDNMDHFNLPVRAMPFEKISRRIPLLKKTYRAYAKKILGKYTTDPEPNEILITILHTKIRARINNGLAIGEMQVSENEFVEVIDVLQSMAKKLGLNKIIFHCSKGSELHRLLSENYTSVPSFTVISKDLNSWIPLGAIKFSYGDIDIF